MTGGGNKQLNYSMISDKVTPNRRNLRNGPFSYPATGSGWNDIMMSITVFHIKRSPKSIKMWLNSGYLEGCSSLASLPTLIC